MPTSGGGASGDDPATENRDDSNNNKGPNKTTKKQFRRIYLSVAAPCACPEALRRALAECTPLVGANAGRQAALDEAAAAARRLSRPDLEKVLLEAGASTLTRRLHDCLVAGKGAAAVARILEEAARMPLSQRRALLNAAVAVVVAPATSGGGGSTPTETLLQTAHRLGRSDVVGLLLVAGADSVGHEPGKPWSRLMTTGACPPPVALAITHGQVDGLRALFRSGNFDPNAMLPYKFVDATSVRERACTAAHLCVNPQAKGDGTLLPPQVACLALLSREFGVDVASTTDCWGRTPVHWIAETGRAPTREEALDFLLERGASLQKRSNARQTPLFFVVPKCNLAMLKLLLAKGASADAINSNGASPLLWACQRAKGPDRRALIQLLLAASSSETRRTVTKGNGWSAADYLLQHWTGGQAAEPDPWECQAVAAIMAAGASVKPEHALRVLPGAARLGIRLNHDLDERGLSPSTCWRREEAMIGLAFDVRDAREAQEALEVTERRVAELEAELRALGVGVEETDDDEKEEADGNDDTGGGNGSSSRDQDDKSKR